MVVLAFGLFQMLRDVAEFLIGLGAATWLGWVGGVGAFALFMWAYSRVEIRFFPDPNLEPSERRTRDIFMVVFWVAIFFALQVVIPGLR
jgi:hypothetical protein